MDKKKLFDDEKLISVVQDYKCLYDKNDMYYDDLITRGQCWKHIAREMGENENICRKKWKHLREAYRKSIRIRENRKDNYRPWKYAKQMEFLKCFVGKIKKDRDSDDNKESDSDNGTITDQDNNSNHESLTPYENNSMSKGLAIRGEASYDSRLAIDPFVNNMPQIETSDPIMKFFASMAETVRTLPLKLQIKAKKDILDIVSNAELAAVSGEY